MHLLNSHTHINIRTHIDKHKPTLQYVHTYTLAHKGQRKMMLRK